MLDGSSLLPVPADQVEAAAAFGIGAVGDDAEVAHPIAVIEQLTPGAAEEWSVKNGSSGHSGRALGSVPVACAGCGTTVAIGTSLKPLGNRRQGLSPFPRTNVQFPP